VLTSRQGRPGSPNPERIDSGKGEEIEAAAARERQEPVSTRAEPRLLVSFLTSLYQADGPGFGSVVPDGYSDLRGGIVHSIASGHQWPSGLLIKALWRLNTWHRASCVSRSFPGPRFVINILLVDKWGRIKTAGPGIRRYGPGPHCAGDCRTSAANRHHVYSHGPGRITIFNLVDEHGAERYDLRIACRAFPDRGQSIRAWLLSRERKGRGSVGSFFLPILKSSWGVPVTILIMALVSLFGLIITMAYRVETKGSPGGSETVKAFGGNDPALGKAFPLPHGS